MSHQYICEYNSVILYGQCVGPGELRAAVMSIERLQKAANAAGYAMAAPDDDADDSATYVRPQATGTAVAVVTAETRAATAPAPSAFDSGSTWLKSLLPAAIGGRATA